MRLPESEVTPWYLFWRPPPNRSSTPATPTTNNPHTPAATPQRPNRQKPRRLTYSNTGHRASDLAPSRHQRDRALARVYEV